MKQLKTNLILAAVLVVLSSFMYWFVYQKKPAIEKTEQSTKRLFTLEDDTEVKSIRIDYQDKDKTAKIEMHCSEFCKGSDPNAKWQITEPLLFPGDASNIQTFLNGMTTAMINETIPVEGEKEVFLQKFGLSKQEREKKRVFVEFKDKKFALYLGDNAAISENLYAYAEDGNSKNQNRILMLPLTVKTNITRNLSFWRSKKLFEFDVSQVNEFSIRNAYGQTIVQKQNGDWFVKKPNGKSELADQPAVETFLTSLTYMNSNEYLSDNKAKAKAEYKFPASAKFKFTASLAPSKTSKETAIKAVEAEVFEVAINKKTPQLFTIFADKSFVAQIDRSSAEKFNKKSQDFWDKTVLDLQTQQKAAKVNFSILAADKKSKLSATAVLEKGSNWKIVQPKGNLKEFDFKKFLDGLNHLHNLKVAEYMLNQASLRGSVEISDWEFRDNEDKLLRSFRLMGDLSKKGDFFVVYRDAPFQGEIGKLEKAKALRMPMDVTAFTVEKKD